MQIASATPENIARAAQILRDGGLVAFPTETVYGLGANALDENAVRKIFAAKERPASNPLIVHVADVEAARQVAREWPPLAQQLAREFWPGPLSIIVAKDSSIPDLVTANLPTVAVRVPSHPVALQLLREARLPIAAPSANLFMQLSPTHAAHVGKSLGARPDLILVGGHSEVGIESTIIDLSGAHPRLLRPGAISRAQIKAVVGTVDFSPDESDARSSDETPRVAPGQFERHYAPRAPAYLCDDVARAALQFADRRVGVLAQSTLRAAQTQSTLYVEMPREAVSYARRIYAALHELDEANCDVILIEHVPDGAEWDGVRDRLKRATQSTLSLAWCS